MATLAVLNLSLTIDPATCGLALAAAVLLRWPVLAEAIRDAVGRL